MSITKEQQQALDDALILREQRLRIGNCNYRLSTTFKPKEPTFQVALDVLSLTPFYQAFLISASICPNLPGQKFVDPLFEEEILTFMRELGYSGNIKSLSDVKVEILPQPWRTFGTIINKCLSGKVTGLDLLRLSRAQILWDQSLPRRNKVDWHMAKDDPILTIMRFIPQHEVVQKYGAILPDYLTNQAMKESEAYKTYYDLATGKVTPKPNKRLKATAKVAKSGKKKQPTRGLETLSEIALTEAEQMKVVTKRSKKYFHSSHASGSGANERTGVIPGAPDVPIYTSEDKQISWKSSDEEDDDEVSMSKDDDDKVDDEDDDDELTESDNDGDKFVHPKFTTHAEEERQDKEDKEEEGSDLRVQTPSHYESTDDEVNDEVNQGGNAKREEQDEEETNEEEEVNELYRDVNVNLERRDTEMTDANFEDRVKALEDDFSEFKQTNQFVEVVSSIPSIVDTYLANKMNEAVKAAVQLQSDRLRDKAQAENEDFINKIDENIKKIIKDSKTSMAVGANLSELELKNILIDKMENNKSNDRSVQQKNLYKALVDAYEADKGILDTYGDTVTLKRRRDDEDEDKEPSADRTVGWSNEKIRAWKKKPEPSTRLLYVLQCTKEKDFKESARNVYSKHRILAVTKLKIVEWHNYKHLDWITVHRNDDKLCTFKEGDYKRLRLQDIKDMLLLLVQGKLTNLNVEERLALGVSLRMFTRSIVIRRRVEDLQLGVKIYQKKLNLTRPDMYRSDIK
ncbi:hypothetical protein Tco_0299912 [Tanacetum coccineum]